MLSTCLPTNGVIFLARMFYFFYVGYISESNDAHIAQSWSHKSVVIPKNPSLSSKIPKNH